MRQKDFDEVAVVLGNELRLCDANEADGIGAAFGAIVGHAEHRYPEVDAERVRAKYLHAVQHGWGQPEESSSPGAMSLPICKEVTHGVALDPAVASQRFAAAGMRLRGVYPEFLTGPPRTPEEIAAAGRSGACVKCGGPLAEFEQESGGATVRGLICFRSPEHGPDHPVRVISEWQP